MASVKRTGEELEAVQKKLSVPPAPKVVQEPDVGITQYLNKSPIGFFGAVKQRYSDFQVFELDQDGKVVHLTDQGPVLGASLKEKRQEKRRANRESGTEEKDEKDAGEANKTKENEGKDVKEDVTEDLKEDENEKENKGNSAKEETESKREAAAKENGAKNFVLGEENRAKLSEHLSTSDIEGIQKVMENGGSFETSTQFSEKATRTLLHQLLRQAFDGKLDTSTSSENTFKVSVSTASSRKNNNVNHVDEKGIVNYGLGPYKNYLHFTVYKENRETMEVANTLTKFLRVPNKSVRYAGTKDRRGVTCQRFCIHKAKVARVTSLNKALKGTILGGFAYSDRGLDLGDLSGNEFVIALRDARVLGDADLKDVVHGCFSSLLQTGFINYYGLQRFGTFSILTHVLGIHLLKEDWKGAVELLLAEQERVVPDSVESRRKWAETGDAAEALRLMPRRCLAEHAVLTLLAKNKTQGEYTTDMYFRAILSIPRNLRLIYVHAYQSYIWNLVALKRMELFGLSVQEGDLVYAAQEAATFAEDTADTAVRVHALTAQDIETNKHTIYDVVLPSPGCDVQYPANPQLMQVYEAAMKKDGLDPHSMGRKIREFSLAGSYRKILARAHDVSYEITKYHEDTDSILYTDLELLEKGVPAENLGERVISSPELSEKTAVILRMKLGVSSYATMALREFMKSDSATAEN